jgi:putative acetyltransferase
MKPTIVEARDSQSVEMCRELIREYQRGVGTLECFKGFEEELAALPGDYAPPRGRLLLALSDGEPVGCVGLRPLDAKHCEMKRLYVRDSARGTGLGRTLTQRVIREARAIGYSTIKLDTLPSMAAAQALYQALGFRDTARYNDQVEGVRFMALELGAGEAR